MEIECVDRVIVLTQDVCDILLITVAMIVFSSPLKRWIKECLDKLNQSVILAP